MFWGFAMEKRVESAQKGSEKTQWRSEDEKLGGRKWIVQTLNRIEERQKRIDRRTRMLAAGLRELFILGEDYVSMVACQDEIDVAILSALREAGATGRQSGELASQLDIDHRDVSRSIYRMNNKMEQEIGENIIQKHGHKWKIIPRLRRDFAAARGKESS
ncbi:MAG: hypothetical protein CW716_08815 [Candidatus Bathyarchaeum sp.]|nr:MAG: hypothetical protein CW716_08815 [Candidatus Bathyarchaeum sp.]